MLDLKKSGLFIANGDKISVLIKVAGVAPMLSIISGVLLNDMEKDGTVTALTPLDPEIQDIVCNPHKYIFDTPTASDIIKNELGLDDEKTLGKVEYNDTQFTAWLDKFKEYKKMFPAEHESKMIVLLMREYNYTIVQSKQVITKLKRYIIKKQYENDYCIDCNGFFEIA